MRDDIADLVHAIFRTGMDYKERLAGGERLEVEEVQSELLTLLSDARLRSRGRDDLGARFALVCWLDEIFIDDTPWGQQWSQRSLEYDQYGTRDRAHLFWHPGADSATDADTVEVYYLCIMLGFRGDFANQPEALRRRVDEMQRRVIRGYSEEPPKLDDSAPENYVPVLTGQEKFQTMLKAWGAALLFAVFVWVVALGIKFMQ
jgi:type VI secretion system protein ImpK